MGLLKAINCFLKKNLGLGTGKCCGGRKAGGHMGATELNLVHPWMCELSLYHTIT
jgi:hypothetical protein